MNGKDIFRGLQYIGDDLIENAETGQFPVQNQESGKTRRPIRRPLLIAAVIALLLLLVGCAAVYVLKMEHVKISSGTDQRDYSLVDGVYVKDPHTIDTTTLSMAGLKGSNAYKACADFYAYETELRASASASGDWTGYDDAINAKAQELAEQYGLKPEGQPLTFRTTRNLCDALGVERFVRDSQDVSIDISQGFCRDSGNFFVLLSFAFPEDQGYEVTYTSGALYWNRQDTFSREYFTLEDRGDWVERNYTTSAGNTVLILTSPSQERGYIICDRGDALMTVWLDANPEILSEDSGVVSAEYLHMTEKQLNMVADALDFAIQPNIPAQADVDAQPAPPQKATQNGYTLEVKSVETDGYVAQILIGITAPEDIVLSTEKPLHFANWRGMLVPADGSEAAFGPVNTLDDGDGKANTIDVLLTQSVTAKNTDAPFAAGSTWTLYLVDLVYSSTDETLTEGEWQFPISFGADNCDDRELELLTSPILMKAGTGWLPDGTDVVMEFPVSSFKLRKFSNKIVRDTAAETEEQRAESYTDFYGWNGHFICVVMKDGTRIELWDQENDSAIDLTQVDYVLLPDGTKLPVPEQ
ncbi:MAG: hypothetical protein HPZ81_04460 [Oscillospiraceae bacterium]|nr:hypothetical protein [Oscillospiraceae bacterium]